MKKTLALAGSLLFAVAVGQQLVTIADSTKSMILRTKEISIQTLPGPVFRFDLRVPGGQVYAASKKQGIELYAPRIRVDAISTNKKEADAIRSATATGGIRALQTKSGGRSEITGSTARYVTKGSGATLNVTGPVKLTNFSGNRQGFVATGSALAADLAGNGTGNGLRTATLSGPVRITIRQAARAGTAATNMNITAQRLVVNQAARPATVVLSGGVRVDGVVPGTTIQGSFGRVVLTLNAAGEVVNVEGN